MKFPLFLVAAIFVVVISPPIHVHGNVCINLFEAPDLELVKNVPHNIIQISDQMSLDENQPKSLFLQRHNGDLRVVSLTRETLLNAERSLFEKGVDIDIIRLVNFNELLVRYASNHNELRTVGRSSNYGPFKLFHVSKKSVEDILVKSIDDQYVFQTIALETEPDFLEYYTIAKTRDNGYIPTFYKVSYENIESTLQTQPFNIKNYPNLKSYFRKLLSDYLRYNRDHDLNKILNPQQVQKIIHSASDLSHLTSHHAEYSWQSRPTWVFDVIQKNSQGTYQNIQFRVLDEELRNAIEATFRGTNRSFYSFSPRLTFEQRLKKYLELGMTIKANALNSDDDPSTIYLSQWELEYFFRNGTFDKGLQAFEFYY